MLLKGGCSLAVTCSFTLFVIFFFSYAAPLIAFTNRWGRSYATDASEREAPSRGCADRDDPFDRGVNGPNGLRFSFGVCFRGVKCHILEPLIVR